jgi:hypothetical protein
LTICCAFKQLARTPSASNPNLNIIKMKSFKSTKEEQNSRDGMPSR